MGKGLGFSITVRTGLPLLTQSEGQRVLTERAEQMLRAGILQAYSIEPVFPENEQMGDQSNRDAGLFVFGASGELPAIIRTLLGTAGGLSAYQAPIRGVRR